LGGIFLSYSRADRDHAHAVVQGLRALGVEVWWDEDMPGVEWQYELVDRITEMAAVMVLWSPKSLDSKNVRDEARLAYKQDKLINALIGIAEPREPFASINGMPLDGWDGREPHNGWRRLVQTAESFLVKVGDVQPGAVVAALDRIEAEWAALKLEHRKATESFSEAQVALTEALENEQNARAAASAANSELRRIAQLDINPKTLGAAIAAAQQFSDERATALAEANSAVHSARGKLSHASRKMKRLEDALKRPEVVIPVSTIEPPPLPPETVEPGPKPEPTSPAPSQSEPSAPVNAAPASMTTDETVASIPGGASKGAATPVPQGQGVTEQIGAARTILAEHRVKVLGALGVVGAVALAGALVPSGEQVPVPEPNGQSATPRSAVAINDLATVSPSPTPKPGEWLIGEWVIDQDCNSKLGVAASDKDGFLRFYDPAKNADSGEEDKITILSEGKLHNTLYIYSRQPNGNITMQLLRDPKVRLELSKCAG